MTIDLWAFFDVESGGRSRLKVLRSRTVVVYPQTSSKQNVTCILEFKAHAWKEQQLECWFLFPSVLKQGKLRGEEGKKW